MENEKEGDENEGSKILSLRETNLDRDIGRQKARIWKRISKGEKDKQGEIELEKERKKRGSVTKRTER